MIVSLIRFANTATNSDLRRRLATNAARVPINVRVNVDVAIAIGRCMIVGLNGTQSDRKLRSLIGVYRLF